jgi:isoleucyl-tRNA synthetase
LGHGQVLAEDGQEMHKSWGNAIWFDEAAENMGADVMRWIYSSSKPENNVLFGYTKANEVRRLFFMTLFNVYNFFYQYASLDNWTPDQQPEMLDPLDKWILSRLQLTIGNSTTALDDYDAMTACNEIDRFVDALSKWYVRRSRRRFWKTEADDEKRAAYSTLYRCLKTVTYLMAPVCPHVSEALYQRMVKPVEANLPESVHHCNWPMEDHDLIDKDLMEEMDLAMNLSSLGRSARSQGNIKLRQPLRDAIILVPSTSLESLEKVKHLVREELNVKELKVTTKADYLKRLKANPIPSKLGKKYGKDYPKIQSAIKAMPEDKVKKLRDGASIVLSVDNLKIELFPEEVEISSVPREGYSVAEGYNLIVGVDTVITEELESEGLARDIVRRIQALRKEADFDINDHIVTYYTASPEVEEVFEDEAEYIKSETLSDSLIRGTSPKDAATQDYEIDGLKLRLGLKKTV